MGLMTLLLLLILFTWLAVVVERRIRARAKAAAALSTTRSLLNQGWRARGRQPEHKDEVCAFRTWATTTFADQPALQHWLAALSDEVIPLLIAKVSDFCADMGFQFTWLLDHKTDQDETLAPRLQTIVVEYLTACYQAHLVQDDIQVFQTWQDLTEHPYGEEQQALTQRLLAQLIDEGLSPAAARSLLTLPAKERDVYIAQAVREAAEKHSAAFRSVLKRVITVPVDPEPATEAITN